MNLAGPARDVRAYATFCGHWAALHECEANAEFMLRACAASCATTDRLPHSLAQILGETDPHSALSLEASEVRAVLSLAPAVRGHVDAVLRERDSPRPMWYAHDQALADLAHGWHYRLSVLEPQTAVQNTSDVHGASAAKLAPSPAGPAKRPREAPIGAPEAVGVRDTEVASKPTSPVLAAELHGLAVKEATLALEAVHKIYVELPAELAAELRDKAATLFDLAHKPS